MKAFFIFASVVATAFPVLAGDPLAPVRAVMDMTVSNWAEGSDGSKDIFAADILPKIYSRDFADKYRAAAKFPAFDDGGSPFDYDVIVNGQDGCALQDISMVPDAPKAGVTDVMVKFRNTTCFGSEPEYQGFRELHFSVIDEGGKAVIDDIHSQLDEVKFGSLKADMVEIAKQ
ncbi:MAG: hypothetical protein ACOH2J_06620 [Allorhizobium sp.]